MNFTGNWFDIVFIAVLLISAILAFLRGFIKDFTSFLNWLIAISLTYALSPYVTKLFAKTSYSKTVINLSVGIILFIVLLIIISLITSKISKSLSNKIPRSVDGSLGFAFGFAKSYFIVALLFSIIVAFYSSGIIPNYFEESAPKKFKGRVGPEWLVRSQSYKILEVGADILHPITNSIMMSIDRAGIIEDGKEKIKKKIQDRIMEKLDEVEKTNHDENESGYDAKEIQKMNRLIEVIDKQN